MTNVLVSCAKIKERLPRVVHIKREFTCISKNNYLDRFISADDNFH